VNELPSIVTNNPNKVDASSEFGLLSMISSTKVSATAKKATTLDTKLAPVRKSARKIVLTIKQVTETVSDNPASRENTVAEATIAEASVFRN